MSELPPGAITSADLYRKMEDLRVNVTVAMEKLANHATEVSDHEARIRALERFASKLIGQRDHGRHPVRVSDRGADHGPDASLKGEAPLPASRD